jgi:class 3 adenylate cyclase
MNITTSVLGKLLQERNEYPARAAEIDTYGQTRAIFVLDMSGFSRMTIQHGIVHFLSMIHRMSTIAVPIIEGFGGDVIKLEADNIFAVFPEVDAAVNACQSITHGLSAANTMLPKENDMRVSIGIGYGEILIVQGGDMNTEGRDLYGTEVNLASKLGEDLCECGEILLTENAFERLNSKPDDLEIIEVAISGLQLKIYKLKIATILPC